MAAVGSSPAPGRTAAVAAGQHGADPPGFRGDGDALNFLRLRRREPARNAD